MKISLRENENGQEFERLRSNTTLGNGVIITCFYFRAYNKEPKEKKVNLELPESLGSNR